MLKKLNTYAKQSILFALIIAVGVALDQLTKWIATTYLKPIHDFPLIKDVFHLTYSENPGAAFGILSNDRWVFMTFSSVMIVALAIYLFYPKKTQSRVLFGIAVSLVISGGIGNMIDRIAYGKVVDFFYFKLINFAIFNVADVFVCVGAGLMLLDVVLELIDEVKRKEKK